LKLHIIGLPSAGKTTLAKDLATWLDVPHHDLDALAFVDERWTLRPSGDRDLLLEGILKQSNFVTEGGFLGWTEPLFAAADRILWLDPPLRVLVWRHVRRHGQRPWRLPPLLRFQIRSYVRPPGAGPANDDFCQTRSGIEVALRPWAEKVLRLNRPITAGEVIADRLQPLRQEQVRRRRSIQ
jgi:hypothetical protein